MKDFADLIATLGRLTWRALDLMRVCAARDRAAIVEHFAHLGGGPVGVPAVLVALPRLPSTSSPRSCACRPDAGFTVRAQEGGLRTDGLSDDF